MRDYFDVTTQDELDRVVAEGNIPVCREGWFRLDGNASAELDGNASARLYGNASARLYGNASAELYGNASARLDGNASAEAVGATGIWARGNTTVNAGPYVSVHRYGDTPKVTGGVLIQIPDLSDPRTFIDFYGVEKKGRKGSETVVLFKAVSDDFKSDWGADYTPGTKLECPDWDPAPSCGNGLHFSPRPFMARRYSNGPKFVACKVKLSEIVVIGGDRADKVKTPRVLDTWEVDEDGTRIETSEAAVAAGSGETT